MRQTSSDPVIDEIRFRQLCLLAGVDPDLLARRQLKARKRKLKCRS